LVVVRGYYIQVKVKVKQFRYRPEQAQSLDRGIDLPFRDLGARRGVWSASRPGRFTPGKDPVPIVQEALYSVYYYLLSLALQPSAGYGLLIHEVS
jgi:hypothetical protein